MRPLLVLFFMCALHVATGGGADAAIDTASMSAETGADGVFFALALQQQSLGPAAYAQSRGACAGTTPFSVLTYNVLAQSLAQGRCVWWRRDAGQGRTWDAG